MKRICTLSVLLLCFMVSAWAQFSGEGAGTKSNPYKITNASQLAQMANFLNNSTVVFQLENDIDLTDWIVENSASQGWLPVGTSSSPFKGTFYGQNHTVSGLVVNRTITHVGLWGYLSNATICDLTIKAGTMTSGQFVGVLAGYGNGVTVSNCHVVLAGDLNTENTSGDFYVGGMFGQLKGTCTSCTVRGDIHNNNTSVTSGYYGGICGYANEPTTISSCKYIGTITGKNNVGGIAGYSYSANVTGCSVKGEINGTNYVGGMVGQASRHVNVTNCVMIGQVKGNEYVGGITGYGTNAVSSSGLVGNNLFSGNIVGSKHVGGIVGCASSKLSVSMNMSYAEIYGSTNVGGIVGRANGSLNYQNTVISKNLAVNTLVSSSNDEPGRIIGSFTNNYVVIGDNGSDDENRSALTTIMMSKGETIQVTDDTKNGAGSSSAFLTAKSNYVSWGWDFADNWNIIDNATFPFKPYQATPPIVESKLESKVNKITGKSLDGGTVYLSYNGLADTIATTVVGTDFSINIQPLIEGTVVRLYVDDGIKFPSYTVQETVIKGNTILVSGITLNETNVNLSEGEEYQLTATVLPANATNKSVTWKSSQSSVVKVDDNGVITAIAVGDATITCTATDGSDISATCTVTVSQKIEPEYVTVTMSNTYQWGTWFGSDDLGLVDGLEAYIVTGADAVSGVVTLAKQSVVKANTPMVLHRTSAISTFNLPKTSGVIISGTPSEFYQGVSTPTDVMTLSVSGRTIYILVNDAFVRTRSGVLPAGKCYLALPNGAASRLALQLDDETMGVSNPTELKDRLPIIYNLQGQRVDAFGKGLYIINGKKYVVR